MVQRDGRRGGVDGHDPALSLEAGLGPSVDARGEPQGDEKGRRQRPGRRHPAEAHTSPMVSSMAR